MFAVVQCLMRRFEKFGKNVREEILQTTIAIGGVTNIGEFSSIENNDL